MCARGANQRRRRAMTTEMKDLDAPLASETAVTFASRAQETRDAFLDNAKYALMMIVVWNHAMQEFLRYVDDFENRQWCEEDSVNIGTHKQARVFYLTLATVGMPAFTCVSGYVSTSWLNAAREDEASAENLLRRVRVTTKSLMGTYALWQFIGMLVVSPTTAPAQWWAPVGPMWYLLALFFWRMSVLVLGGLKDVVILAFALFMGLFVGFTETAVSKNDLAVFDLQRVFVYAVYFYIGCCVIKPQHLKKLKQMEYGKRAMLGAIILIGVAITWYVSLYAFGACFDEAQWSVWSTRPYNSGSIGDMFSGMAQRIGLYAFTIVAVAGFFALVPSEKSIITDMGSRTLYCYVLHIYLVRGFSKFLNLVWDDAPLSLRLICAALILPLIVGNALMSRWVLLLKPIVEPNLPTSSRMDDDVAARAADTA